MTGIAPFLPVDDLPLGAHRLLCALGDRPGMTLVTTRDYASRYRAFYGHVSATNPLRPPDTLVRHVIADTLRSYADDLARRLGPRQARLDLVKLAVALRAILPGTVLPDFRIEYARLRQMPEPERPRFRYALAIGDVPAVLLDLVADIDTAERVVDTGTAAACEPSPPEAKKPRARASPRSMHPPSTIPRIMEAHGFRDANRPQL